MPGLVGGKEGDLEEVRSGGQRSGDGRRGLEVEKG